MMQCYVVDFEDLRNRWRESLTGPGADGRKGSMEGISGIHLMSKVKKEFPADYAYGKKLLMEEINFVVDTLFSLGADEVVVRDGHAGGYNIDMGEMDGRAVYEPAFLPSLAWLEESFDGLIIIGQHSMAGTLNGFLNHTMNSMEWFQYRINGMEAGEIAILASRAGARGVPVLVVTGDRMAIFEAEALLGKENISCAAVKEGIGRNWANCLPVQKARQAIREALEEAVLRIGKVKPYKPQLPAVLELTFYRSDFADHYNERAEWERVDARTVRRVVNSFTESMW